MGARSTTSQSGGSDAEQLRETRQLLEQEQRRYQELFDLAPVGYLLTDLDGFVLEVNQAASELLAREVGALLGTSLADLVAVERRREFRELLGELAQGARWQDEFPFLAGGGGSTLLLVYAAPPDAGAPGPVRWALADAPTVPQPQRRSRSGPGLGSPRPSLACAGPAPPRCDHRRSAAAGVLCQRRRRSAVRGGRLARGQAACRSVAGAVLARSCRRHVRTGREAGGRARDGRGCRGGVRRARPAAGCHRPRPARRRRRLVRAAAGACRARVRGERGPPAPHPCLGHRERNRGAAGRRQGDSGGAGPVPQPPRQPVQPARSAHPRAAPARARPGALASRRRSSSSTSARCWRESAAGCDPAPVSPFASTARPTSPPSRTATCSSRRWRTLPRMRPSSPGKARSFSRPPPRPEGEVCIVVSDTGPGAKLPAWGWEVRALLA